MITIRVGHGAWRLNSICAGIDRKNDSYFVNMPLGGAACAAIHDVTDLPRSHWSILTLTTLGMRRSNICRCQHKPHESLTLLDRALKYCRKVQTSSRTFTLQTDRRQTDLQ